MTRIRAIPSFICVPTRAAATTAAPMQVPVLATDSDNALFSPSLADIVQKGQNGGGVVLGDELQAGLLEVREAFEVA